MVGTARRARFPVGLALLVPAAALAQAATPLQPLIDAAPAGGVVRLAPGRYLGPVVLERPLTLEGGGRAVLEGGGHGSVVTVRAPGTVVRGLRITGSGESHDQMDAAVVVEADRVRVEDNVVDDALFGVLLKGSSESVVCGNLITSKPAEPAMRGDGVRVWNGRHNRVVGNELTGSRDVGVANAPENLVAGNLVRGGRNGLQVVFSPRTRVEENWFDGNLAGVVVLYSDNVVLRRNRVQHSRGASGAGITFKESSFGLVDENSVVDCAVGARANSPTSPDNILFFRRNRFAHNVAGMDFYGENGGHVIHGNRFEQNLSQVTVSAPMSARGNDWRGNRWDDYRGFDLDHDGVGDTPFELYTFSDRIWMETPHASFFRNAPALELLDFLERLAPFASPELLLRDPRPVTGPLEVVGISAPPPRGCASVRAEDSSPAGGSP